jgi:outer membrane biosynthesis protein TonB
MHRVSRIMLLGGLVVLAPMLAACENFDPDKLDVFGLTDKKKLPGERKALFPEGVPGVQQGIPPEYMRGAQQPANPYLTQPVETDAGNASQAAAPAQEPSPPPAAKPRAASKPKPQPKPKTAAAPPPPPPQQPAASSQQQQQSNWPAPNQQQTPWPSAPASGTFSR